MGGAQGVNCMNLPYKAVNMSASVSSKFALAASAVFASATIYAVHRYQKTEQEVRRRNKTNIS